MNNDILHKVPAKIRGSGTYQLPPGVSTRYFAADDWRFVFVEEGEAVYKFDKIRETVKRGDFFLLGPNERKISTFRSSSFKISVIYFDVKDGYDEFSLINFKNRSSSYRLLLEMFKEILGHQDEDFHLDLLNSMLKIFVRDLEDQSSNDGRIEKAINIIKQQNGWRLTAEQLSQKVGLSRAHFNTLFKAQTGKSYALFCREFRMHLALTLMQEYGISSKQAANEIGSSSAQAFSREFKSFFGLSPRGYVR